MTVLWWLIDPIAPGAGSMFLFIAALYWLGFGLPAIAVARRSLMLGIVTPMLGAVPPAFILLAMIWRDILFARGVARRRGDRLRDGGGARDGAGRSRRWRSLRIGFGVLLRPNAIVAAPLLVAYVLWPARFEWKRTALLYLPALALGYGLVEAVYYGLLDAKREHPPHSIMVFDLGGITHFTGENQFPAAWNAQETALLTSSATTPSAGTVTGRSSLASS